MKNKYFKHYVDAHEGFSLQTLMDEFRHAGPSVYWIIVEMCTAKFWELAANNPDKSFREIEPKFRFHKRLLIQKTRLRFDVLWRLLVRSGDLSLLAVTADGNQIEITMPKILEILDRDSKRARKPRVERAPKTKDLRLKSSPKSPDDKLQTADSETESDPDPNQLVLPGLLKPGGDVRAVDLLNDAKNRKRKAGEGGEGEKSLSHASVTTTKVLESIGKALQ